MDKFGRMFGNLWTSLNTGWNNFWGKVQGDASKGVSVKGSVSGNTSKGTTLTSYDVGTNYVPHDMVAKIHEGEAIIPKKFNNEEFLGGSGNEETNNLLGELIAIVQSKNMVIGDKAIGRSASNYFTKQARRTGESIL